jgi:hypothetical protein
LATIRAVPRTVGDLAGVLFRVRVLTIALVAMAWLVGRFAYRVWRVPVYNPEGETPSQRGV